MNPNIRTVTDLTTIPASVVQVGTLTPYGSDVLLLEYSGTAAALDAILVQAGANKDQQKIDLWVWDGTSTAPFNITAWFGKFIKVDRDASAYTGDFNLIESKLFGWEVISTGDGTGTVSGSAIGALNTISFKPITDFFVDPVVVEGNVSDNLTVLEFYNQQAGSGTDNGGSNYIEVDKAGFLALVAANALTFPAIYKVTDIDNGLFLETLSENTFSTSGTLSLFVPSYEASGVNLGQMDAVTIPTIAANDMVIWGDHYWVNETASPITPTIIDTTTLDGGLTQIIKASGSIYDIVEYPCQIDADLNILSVTSNTGSQWSISSAIANAGGNGLHIYAQLNDALVAVDNLVSTLNHKGRLGASSPFIQGEVIMNNSAKMTTIFINGEGNEVSGNKSSGEGGYDNINLVNTSRFKDNDVSGASYQLTQIGFIELFDNAECTNNTIIGDGAIWDIRTGEETKVNGNIVDCGLSPTPFFTNAVIQDVDQMYNDEVNDNELYGEGSKIAMIHQFGFSKLNGNVLNGDETKIRFIRQSNAELNNFTLTSADKVIERLELRGAILQNGNDISITDCEFSGINIDFTGFTVDISNEVIEGGKGWFVVTHDFATNPLNSGSAALYNIIPVGAKVTSIKAYGDATGGAGATLAFGIDTDAPNLIPAAVLATVNAGQIYSLLSATATANRSLAITAGVDNVTGGSVTVLVEFMV